MADRSTHLYEQAAATGLNEVAAPAPEVNPHEHGVHREHFLESREKSSAADVGAPSDKTLRALAPLEQRPKTSDARGHGSPTKSTDVQENKKYVVSPEATRIFTIGQLALFSILGTLARLGLQTLTTYHQAPLSQGLVWANFGGSFVMGYLSEERSLFREEWGPRSQPKIKAESSGELDTAAERRRHSSVKKTIPLFIGLATGFCGSFTSFSSFQRDVFLNLSNSVAYDDRTYPVARAGGYSFLALLATLILTPCLSLAALSGGAHFAIFTERFTPAISFPFMRGFIDPLLSFLGYGCWFGAVIMSIWPPDRPYGPANDHDGWERETWRGQALFALVFAPVGALTRYYVSMWLNPKVASFPLGTFTVNMFGTLMEAVFFDLQHAPLVGAAIGGGIVGCQVLQGLQDGLCGCLTTVSTWVVELKSLKRGHAYVYGLLSLLVGLVIMVVVMGSLRWTLGFAAPACKT